MRYSFDFKKWRQDWFSNTPGEAPGCLHEIRSSLSLGEFHPQLYATPFQQKEIAVLREILLQHPRIIFIHKPAVFINYLAVGDDVDAKLIGIQVKFGVYKEIFEHILRYMIIDKGDHCLVAIQDISLSRDGDGFHVMYYVIEALSATLESIIRKHTIDTFLSDNA